MKEESNNQKKSKTLIVMALILMMLLTLCIGIFLGKKIFESKNDTKENNQETKNDANDNKKQAFIDIRKDLESGKKLDNISATYNNSCFEKIVIGEKEVVSECDPFNYVTNIYEVENNYLISTGYGDYYYLYDKSGNLIQTIHELDSNNMLIGISDRLNEVEVHENIIELYGTRYDQLSASITINNNSYDICDKELKTKLSDDYVIIAKYQLIYNSNKIEIKKVSGTEITLADELKRFC